MVFLSHLGIQQVVIIIKTFEQVGGDLSPVELGGRCLRQMGPPCTLIAIVNFWVFFLGLLTLPMYELVVVSATMCIHQVI